MTGDPSGRENLGPPPPVFRMRNRPPRHIRWLVPVVAAIGAFIALYLVLDVLRSIYTNLLWFDAVGYGSVYKTRIKTRVWLFFAGVAAFLLIFVANIWLARRLAPTTDDPDFELSPEFREFARQLRSWHLSRFFNPAVALITALIAIAFGASAASHWDRILLFQHAQSFGIDDPQFHRDLGFYVFKLPVYQFIVDWLTAAVIVTIVGVSAIYIARALFYGFRIEGPRPIARELLRLDVPRPIKLHVAALVAALLVVFAARYYLDTFDLVYSTRGVDTGAFYTDVHVSLPVLYALMAVAIGVGVLLMLSAFRRGVAWLIAGVGVWIAVAIIGTQILPLTAQKLLVEPNEITKEQSYMQRNIDMTRYAYGLDDINEQQFPATVAATPQEIVDQLGHHQQRPPLGSRDAAHGPPADPDDPATVPVPRCRCRPLPTRWRLSSGDAVRARAELQPPPRRCADLGQRAPAVHARLRLYRCVRQRRPSPMAARASS